MGAACTAYCRLIPKPETRDSYAVAYATSYEYISTYVRHRTQRCELARCTSVNNLFTLRYFNVNIRPGRTTIDLQFLPQTFRKS